MVDRFVSTPASPAARAAPRALTPERTLLGLGLCFGLLFALLLPPFQAPDEQRHAARAYHLSEGHLATAPGGWGDLPASLPALSDRYLALLPFDPAAKIAPREVLAGFAVPLAPEARRGLWIFGVYTPLPYLPQALGALLGRGLARTLDLPALAVLYLMRLANLLACLALTLAAVRLAPFFRWTLALLALTPMTLFLRSSASADAATNALCALLVAAVLALAAGPPEKRRQNVAVLVAAAAGAALSKGAYGLLPLLVFALPWRRLGATRTGAAAVLAGVLLATAGGVAVSGWFIRNGWAPQRPGVHADPAAQLQVVREDPVRFTRMIGAHGLRNALRYAFQFVGNLGWLDTPLPKWAVAPWLLLLLAVAALDGPAGAPWGWIPRLVAGGIVAATLALICASQYFTWTAVGADSIDGVQGRYFIPAAPLALLLIAGRRSPRLDDPRAGRLLAGAAALLLTVALTTMVLRYYV